MAASLFATSQRKQGSTLVLCFALLFVSFLLFYNSPIARFTTAKPGPRSVLRSSILRSAWKPALSEKSAKSLWGGWNEKKLESAPFPKTEREDLLEALVDGDRDAEAGRQLAWGNGKGDGSETRMDKEARALQRGFQVTWGLGKSRLVATKKDVEEGAQEGQGGGSQGERAGFGDNPGLGIRVNEHRDESSKGWTQNLSAQDRSSALERRGAEGIVEEGGELERGAIRLDASTMRPTWQVDSEDTMDLRLAIDDQDFEEESRTGTEDNGTETDGNGTSGNGTDKKGTNGKGTNGNGTNGNGKVRKEQEQGEGKESGVGAEAKKEQSSSQVTEEYPAEGESGLDSEDGETEGLAGVSFLADESDSEAAARKEEEAESETGEVPGNESAGLEEGASYAKLDKGRKSEGDGLVEKGVESSTTKEASQQGGTSESAEEGGQAARETKTPSYEQIVFPSLSTETLPKISLVLPSKLDECHRAVISLILQSSSTDSAEDAGNGNGTEKENGSTKMELQTPPTVTLIGADPDRAHYEVYPFRKWHTLLCPIMNWSDCGSETAHPPRKWERQLGVTFQGQSEPPRWEAEVFPDVSALSYEVSVSGVEVSSVRFDNGTVGETESGLGDQREGEKGSALRAASGFADTGSADSGFAQRFRLPTPSVQIWEAEGTCRQPWNRSRTGRDSIF